MNSKFSRKVISCILAVVMLFGISATAFAAEERYNGNPVIVINGIDNNPIYANPNTTGAAKVFPPSDLTMMAMTAEMYASGIVALASGEYTEVMNFFVGSQVYEAMEKIQLNRDGTSKSENLGPKVYNHSLSYYYTADDFNTIAGNIGIGMGDRLGYDNVYVFTYDWRLDPIETSHKLDEFIQTVKANSRKEQVSIISEGFGSSIATAYLAECFENATADVDNFVTVNSAALGTSLIGDLFTGRLTQSIMPSKVRTTESAFIRYINDFSDNPATWFAGWLSLYILNKNWETYDFITSVNAMMGHVVDPLYDNYLRDMLKDFTGLWAMVPTDYYDEAMDFMFMSDESTEGDYNADLQERIQSYKNVQESAAEILTKASSEGININVVSSWDIQLAPIGDNSASDEELFGISAQSDGLIDTYYSSFGGWTIPLNDVGAAAQNKDQRNTEGECENHNHLNAVYDTLDPEHSAGAICHYLDASTCALPDNTWFIRNMKHGTFDTNSNSMDFLEYLMTADKTLTVYSANGIYRQFMSYNRYVKPGYIDVFDTPDIDPYLLGDANCDGEINAVDARLVLRISAKLEKYPAVDTAYFKNADINGDGELTAADARIILRCSAGLANPKDYANTADRTEK